MNINNKTYKNYIGIDISKKTLDIAIIDEKNNSKYLKVNNSKNGIKDLLNKLKEQKIDISQSLFCCENTGLYNNILAIDLYENDCDLWIENPLAIIKSQGITRGKNDKMDSKRIADYASTFRKRSKLFKPEKQIMKKLRIYINMRENLLKSINTFKKPFQEYKEFIDEKILKEVSKENVKIIKDLEKRLSTINSKLEKLIEEDEEIKETYTYCSSVPGIGKITAINLLVYTKCFKKFNTSSKLACYMGIVPFEHSSGTSIRKKQRVSHLANKSLKSLIHMGALCSVRNEGELKKYFEQKVKEGKNKMSVINAIRNKLIKRAFACVRDKRKYTEKYESRMQKAS